MNRRPLLLGLAALVAVLAGAAAALGSTGQLSSKGCIADPVNNPDGCAQKAKGLDHASAVAVSPDGRSVYAAGSGDNAIVSFKRNRTTGALTPAGCIADPASNPDGCAKKAKGLNYADALAVSPDGKSVYVAGYDGNAIVRFNRNRRTGALKPAGCIGSRGNNTSGCARTAKGLDYADSVAVSPDGKSVYAAGGEAAVVIFHRTKTGALEPKGCIEARDDTYAKCDQRAKGLNGDGSVVVSPDAKSVYATGSSDNAIVSFKRNKTTGALRPAGCIADSSSNPAGCTETTAGLGDPLAGAVSPDGTSVYVTGYNPSSLVRFRRDKTTGALTPKGCMSWTGGGGCSTVGGLHGAASVAVSPDAKSVYVTGLHSNAVVNFSRNTTTGALTTKQCIADPANNPDGCTETASGLDSAHSVAVSANGKSVYVAGESDNAVVRFRRAL